MTDLTITFTAQQHLKSASLGNTLPFKFKLFDWQKSIFKWCWLKTGHHSGENNGTCMCKFWVEHFIYFYKPPLISSMYKTA